MKLSNDEIVLQMIRELKSFIISNGIDSNLKSIMVETLGNWEFALKPYWGKQK